MLTDIRKRFRIRFVPEMALAAVAANSCFHGRELGIRGNRVGAVDVQFGSINPEHATLVINEAARPEFQQGQESRPADHTAFVIMPISLFTLRWNPCHEGKAREIVSGEEALAREIPEGVEVVVLAAGFQQEGELVFRVLIPAVGVFPVFLAGRGTLNDLIRGLYLPLDAVLEFPPSISAASKRSLGLSSLKFRST